MLEAEKYLSLQTFRKDGRSVSTPVWFAEHAGALWIFTLGESGKVKRLRNSDRARIAACDVRGNVRGAWRDARATLVRDVALIPPVESSFSKKYGLIWAASQFFSKLSGRYARRAWIRVDST